ncbi:MAG: TlyA family rRNA (cytidine-2'-O)-methyltransferase, partial [Opitutae bacterium]|nr:TlyA family rRNA (cytidine-2'-O)-methyltransferase [Opitutae bacterium]
PQFECTRREASENKGVIRDAKVQSRVKEEIIVFVAKQLENSKLLENAEAIPRGADGNLEFFVAWEKRQ